MPDFRAKYRELTPQEVELNNKIKFKAEELDNLMIEVEMLGAGKGVGRYTNLARTALEESVMWIVKELTS